MAAQLVERVVPRVPPSHPNQVSRHGGLAARHRWRRCTTPCVHYGHQTRTHTNGAYGPSTFDACLVATPIEQFGSFVGVDDIDGDGSLDLLISSITGKSSHGGFFRIQAW